VVYLSGYPMWKGAATGHAEDLIRTLRQEVRHLNTDRKGNIYAGNGNLTTDQAEQYRATVKGMSGGPATNKDNKMVGLIAAEWGTEDSIAFLVSHNSIQDMLARTVYGVSCQCPDCGIGGISSVGFGGTVGFGGVGGGGGCGGGSGGGVSGSLGGGSARLDSGMASSSRVRLFGLAAGVVAVAVVAAALFRKKG
jgi:hypothetical protein